MLAGQCLEVLTPANVHCMSHSYVPLYTDVMLWHAEKCDLRPCAEWHSNACGACVSLLPTLTLR